MIYKVARDYLNKVRKIVKKFNIRYYYLGNTTIYFKKDVKLLE